MLPASGGLGVSWLVGMTVLLLLGGCARTVSRRQSSAGLSSPSLGQPQSGQLGVASWYGPGFHGNPTANGEIYNQNALTAAHPTLPLGTQVQVTNLANGKSVQVRINDRGPYIHGRAIDLSRGAAQKLGMVKPGISRVRIKTLSSPRSADRRVATGRQQGRLSSQTRRGRSPQPQEIPLRRLVATIWPF
ncbi:MAG: septal ring lytic transglycosylase RlpA family protein [Deltaproteobacteria bacterium]|nr:septal ring lytic transglycosylase RlpA family protein [Deltaproteobacteria bacterium]